MSKPFHEPKYVLNCAKIEYTATSSLGLYSAFAPVHACDLALRKLYGVATGAPFPYEKFQPFHQPSRLVDSLGIRNEYSSSSQAFLDRLQGYAMQEVRYEGTRAYLNYTSPHSKDLAGELIHYAEQFIQETEAISGKPYVLNIIRKHQR